MAHSSLTGSETVQHVATGSYIFLFNQMLTEPAIQMRFPYQVADIDSIYYPATTPEFLGYLRAQDSNACSGQALTQMGGKPFASRDSAQKSHLSATLVTELR